MLKKINSRDDDDDDNDYDEDAENDSLKYHGNDENFKKNRRSKRSNCFNESITISTIIDQKGFLFNDPKLE